MKSSKKIIDGKNTPQQKSSEDKAISDGGIREQKPRGIDLKKTGELKVEFDRMIAGMQGSENKRVQKTLMLLSDKKLRKRLQSCRGSHDTVQLEIAQQTDLLPLSEAHQLIYPCLASAFLDYFATGEGRTMGVLVMTANSADHLHSEIIRNWGDYFAEAVQVCPWQGVPAGFEFMYPTAVDALKERYRNAEPLIQFASLLHFNLA